VKEVVRLQEIGRNRGVKSGSQTRQASNKKSRAVSSILEGEIVGKKGGKSFVKNKVQPVRETGKKLR